MRSMSDPILPGDWAAAARTFGKVRARSDKGEGLAGSPTCQRTPRATYQGYGTFSTPTDQGLTGPTYQHTPGAASHGVGTSSAPTEQGLTGPTYQRTPGAASHVVGTSSAPTDQGLTGPTYQRTPGAASHVVGTSSAATEQPQPEHRTPGNVQSKDHTTRIEPRHAWFPLSDKEASLFFSKVADTTVMGLVTLATFFSTYLFAWGKPGTKCIPYFNASDPNAKYPDPSWQQIVVGLLPFLVFPFTLYWSGLGKIAEIEKRALSVVSAFCLGEFILAFTIGGMMSYCIGGIALGASIGGTAFLVLVTIVTWGITFKYPKIVRSFIWSMCLRRAEVEQEDV